MAIDKDALLTGARTYHVVLARFTGGAGVRLDDSMPILPKRYDVAEIVMTSAVVVPLPRGDANHHFSRYGARHAY